MITLLWSLVLHEFMDVEFRGSLLLFGHMGGASTVLWISGSGRSGDEAQRFKV